MIYSQKNLASLSCVGEVVGLVDHIPGLHPPRDWMIRINHLNVQVLIRTWLRPRLIGLRGVSHTAYVQPVLPLRKCGEGMVEHQNTLSVFSQCLQRTLYIYSLPLRTNVSAELVSLGTRSTLLVVIKGDHIVLRWAPAVWWPLDILGKIFQMLGIEVDVWETPEHLLKVNYVVWVMACDHCHFYLWICHRYPSFLGILEYWELAMRHLSRVWLGDPLDCGT